MVRLKELYFATQHQAEVLPITFWLHCEISPGGDVSEDEEAAIVEKLMEMLDERGNNVTEEDPTLSAKLSWSCWNEKLKELQTFEKAGKK
jgi:hypothetical protein